MSLGVAEARQNVKIPDPLSFVPFPKDRSCFYHSVVAAATDAGGSGRLNRAHLKGGQRKGGYSHLLASTLCLAWFYNINKTFSVEPGKCQKQTQKILQILCVWGPTQS